MSYLRSGRNLGGKMVPRSVAGLGATDCGCGCKGAGTCGRGGLGDTAAPAPAAVPLDLNTMVADIRQSAKAYVDQDRRMRFMQIGATLLIPFAALVTNTILRIKGKTVL